MLAYVAPLLVLTCHCTVGVGVPVAAAVRLSSVPTLTVWLLGLVVTTGSTGLTFSVAAVVVAVPAALVKTARYMLPDWARVGVKV